MLKDAMRAKSKKVQTFAQTKKVIIGFFKTFGRDTRRHQVGLS
jgi:hypothetical protein